MQTHIFLLDIVAILCTARLLGEIASYLKIPPVFGELLAGIIIGPSVFGLIGVSVPIQLMAQIGLILLLFEVGIETDFSRLRSEGSRAFIVAVVGFVVPLVLGYCISYYLFSLSVIISLFIASALTATSIGITLRVLRDLKCHNTSMAQIIIGAAVIDDVIGIILLAGLYEFSVVGEIHFINIIRLLIFIIVFFIAAPILAKVVSVFISRWDQKSAIPGLLPTTIVALILFFAWAAHVSGAPELLGGFAAGLALSRQFFFPFGMFLKQSDAFAARVENQMYPIINLFTPIFFVYIGLSLNLRAINWTSSYVISLSMLLIIAAILGKLMSGLFLRKMDYMKKLIIGTAMIPRGEVGLIFANVGYSLNILDEDIYAVLILVICVTTLFSPIALRILFKKTTDK